MGLSEAGHLYNPPPISWHLLISKCNSVFDSAACCVADGSDDEHPPSANSPATAIAKSIRFAICSALTPEFRISIEVPRIGSYITLVAGMRFGRPLYLFLDLRHVEACALLHR